MDESLLEWNESSVFENGDGWRRRQRLHSRQQKRSNSYFSRNLVDRTDRTRWNCSEPCGKRDQQLCHFIGCWNLLDSTCEYFFMIMKIISCECLYPWQIPSAKLNVQLIADSYAESFISGVNKFISDIATQYAPSSENVAKVADHLTRCYQRSGWIVRKNRIFD